MATSKKGAADAKKVKADHAKTGRPVSPTEDPTSHKTSAAALAKQIDPKGAGAASVNAKSIDDIEAKDQEKQKAEQEAADSGLAGKIKASELYWVNDHSVGGGPYIGISPNNDPNASQASKLRSNVEPLSMHSPATGLQVRPKDGDSFVIGEGFGLDATPADWARVAKPDGSLLFA